MKLWSGMENCRVSLLLTHLNETGHRISMKNGDVTPEQFVSCPCIEETFDDFYLSASPYAEDVKKLN